MVTVVSAPQRPEFYSHAYTRTEMELSMTKLVARFVKDESGATAIEYGLIAAGISLAIIAMVNTLGGTLNTKFNTINTSLGGQ
jgi:pilus assembly protein Flp/PilA